MIEPLVFPDTRKAIYELMHGSGYLDHEVSAAYHIETDKYGSIAGPFPLAIISTEPGTQGHVDRTDRIVVDVYAEGTMAMETAQFLHAMLVGAGIETDTQYLDSIKSDQAPFETQYQSDTINRATFRIMVIVRPV